MTLGLSEFGQNSAHLPHMSSMPVVEEERKKIVSQSETWSEGLDITLDITPTLYIWSNIVVLAFGVVQTAVPEISTR